MNVVVTGEYGQDAKQLKHAKQLQGKLSFLKL